jgi:putative phosphoribosyl transferase
MAALNRIYADRREAGVELARAVVRRKLRPPVLVLGLPRGGVPLAHEVAKALRAPLDVMIVRKIGMPAQPELAIGAVASGNIIVREHRTSSSLAERGIHFEQLAERERAEVEHRELRYRAGQPPLDLKGKTVVLVDDGLATGSTMLAAVRAARQAGAASVVVAAPVASREAHALLSAEADKMIILQTPQFLYAIGEWYERFDQVEDAEVCRLLEAARKASSATRPPQQAAT